MTRILLLTLAFALSDASLPPLDGYVHLKIVEAKNDGSAKFKMYEPISIDARVDGQLSRIYKPGEVLSCKMFRRVEAFSIVGGGTIMQYDTIFKCGGDQWKITKYVFPATDYP